MKKTTETNWQASHSRPAWRAMRHPAAFVLWTLALLACVTSALAAPAFVQVGDVSIGSGSRTSVALGRANTAGNFIVVYAEWDNSGPVTVTDSNGNVYANALGPTKSGFDRTNAQIFYAKNIRGGANTVTVTFSTRIALYASVYVHEYSGIDAANPIVAVAAASSNSSFMSSGTLNVTSAGALLFGAGESTDTVRSVGNGFIVRSSGYGNSTHDRIATTTGSYRSTARQNGSAWIMQLVAFRAADSGGGAQIPLPPTTLTATAASSTQINLAWNADTANGTPAGYRVYRNGALIATTTSTAYVDSGLAAGTTYSYAVSAFNAAGLGSAQSIAAIATTGPVTTTDTTAPATPANLRATAVSASQINLTWNATTDNIGVTGYRLYRNGSQVASVTGTSFSSTGLSAAATYSYYIVAFDAAGNLSAQSSTVTATTQAPAADTAAPTTPAGLAAAAVSSTQINLSWTASSDNVGVAGYKIFRGGIQIGTSAATAYANTGLAPSSTYTYSVSAYDAAGNNSVQSAAVSATTQTANANGSYVYPLKAGPTGRYPVDQNNKPYLLVGDAAWSLVARLSEADADAYLENRRQKGFTGIIVNLIENKYSSLPPFTGRPFATPNEAYFARADAIILNARQKGIAVFLAPIYLGYNCGDQGWCADLKAATDAELTAWGQYVGNRYNFDNIVWVIGGDTDPAQVKAKVQLVVNGIRQYDTRHLMTAHAAPEQTAAAAWSGASWLGINNVYTYSETLYVNALAAYAVSPAKPYFLLESAYENEHGSTALALRKQSYWAVLSGAFGHIFGNCPMWNFDSAASPSFCAVTNWKTQLDSQGANSMSNLGKLFGSRSWHTLVPDTGHSVLTAGYGTQGGTDYAVAAAASDGSFIAAYLPSARKVTVNATGLSGTGVKAWWFDPASGAITALGTFAKSSAMAFTPPFSSGGDQVLVLDSADFSTPAPDSGSGTSDSQAPSQPSGVTASAASANEISVRWAASVDNIGVAGYKVFRNGVQAASVTTGLSYADTGLTAGATYSYAVSAFDAAGNASPLSAAASATTPYAAASGFVAGYNFNEGSGTTLGDSSGNGVTGVLTGNPTWTTQGHSLGALVFNGSSSYVNLGNPAALQITGSMTLSAWVYASGFPADDAAIVSKRMQIDNGFQLDATVDTGVRTIGFKLSTQAGADMARYGRTAMVPNQWYHVTGVYDATAQTMNVYLNGVLDNGQQIGAVSAAQQNTSINVLIGKRPGASGYEWRGTIDDVRVYNRALSQAEIQADMNVGVTAR